MGPYARIFIPMETYSTCDLPVGGSDPLSGPTLYRPMTLIGINMVCSFE